MFCGLPLIFHLSFVGLLSGKWHLVVAPVQPTKVETLKLEIEWSN